MVLITSEGVYRAHFRHEQGERQGPHDSWWRGATDARRWYAETTCTLHLGECPQQARPCGALGAITTSAKCSKLDNFERRVGHKLAFKRAVEKLTTNRSLRAELWHEYFRSIPL